MGKSHFVGSFCASIHSIDGRIQLAVLQYRIGEKSFRYLDSVTRPAPFKLTHGGAGVPVHFGRDPE